MQALAPAKVALTPLSPPTPAAFAWMSTHVPLDELRELLVRDVFLPLQQHSMYVLDAGAALFGEVVPLPHVLPAYMAAFQHISKYTATARHRQDILDMRRLFTEVLHHVLAALRDDIVVSLSGRVRLKLVANAWETHRKLSSVLCGLFKSVDHIPASKAALAKPSAETATDAATATANDARHKRPPSTETNTILHLWQVIADPLVTFTSQAHLAFKTMVFDPVASSVLEEIFSVVDSFRATPDRDLRLEDVALLKSAVDMCLVMGMCADTGLNLRNDIDTKWRVISNPSTVSPEFVTTLQAPLLARAWATYDYMVQPWVASNDLAMYVRCVLRALDRENALCARYLPRTSHLEMMLLCRSVLLHPYVDWFADGKLQAAFACIADGAAEPASVLSLYSACLAQPHGGITEVPGGARALRDAFSAFVEGRGEAVASALSTTGEDVGKVTKLVKAGDPDYVDGLVVVLHGGIRVLEQGFANCVEAGRAFWRAMETVMCSSPHHAEILAAYLDNVLKGKRGAEKLDEARMETCTSNALELVRYLVDKDLFREFYVNALAKRLLGQRSVSPDAETACVSKMKALFGPHFALKIDAVLTDFRVAADDAQAFNSTRKVLGDTAGIPCGVHVVKSTAWPMLNLFSSLILPPELKKLVAAYASFYEAHNPSRALKWAWGHGTIDANVKFGDKTKVVCGNVLQITTLLQFNAGSKWTVRQLQEATGIPLPALRNVLGSMLFAKDCMVLKKTPKTKTIEDDSVIEVDEGFRNPHVRVVLPSVMLDDKVAVNDAVSSERAYVIDAVLVRIMKARRTLSHTELVQEAVRQIQFFRPDVRHIKTRIAVVLRDGYIAREDPTSHTSPYVYVAGSGEEL